MDCWVNSKFVSEETPETAISFIESLCNNLNGYFGLSKATDDEYEYLLTWFFAFFKENRLIKLCDLERMFYLYKTKPELNKLTADYFQGLFDKYKQSDERREIIKRYQNSIQMIPEKTEKTGSEYLKDCYYSYIETGEIHYNSGKVFDRNANLIVAYIGTQQCHNIVKYITDKTISEIEEEISMAKNSARRNELMDELKSAHNGIGRVKVAWRKLMLKTLFDSHKSGKIIVNELPAAR